jgi:hypothetical protein
MHGAASSAQAATGAHLHDRDAQRAPLAARSTRGPALDSSVLAATGGQHISDVTGRGLVDADAIDLPKVEGLELPEVETRTLELTDDDAGVCRTIDGRELAASYVDNNIVSTPALGF